MIVRKGDTVLVSIPTFLTGIATYSGARSALQGRLQQAGFNVLRVDDSALSYFGALGTRGQLLITVVPTTSDYASEFDVGSLVAGAAYVAGYDINAGASAQIIAQSGAASDAYRDLQNKDNPDSGLDLDKLFAGYGTPLLIGGALLITLVLLKR